MSRKKPQRAQGRSLPYVTGLEEKARKIAATIEKLQKSESAFYATPHH